MARWDDLRRAIRANDVDGAERVWFDLIDSDPTDPTPFIDAADQWSRQPGGKRQATAFLMLLVDAFKEKEKWAPLLRVYHALSKHSPDELTLRGDVLSAARTAYADRADLETLLSMSGFDTPTGDLTTSIEKLVQLLRIEQDAYVFHKSGWGVGRVVRYDADRGRCEIDFRDRPGHEMDVAAAARLLERLEPDDIRVQAMEDPRGLRARAKAEPLEMLRQALARYNNGARLRNIKEALVPDAVATSTWSTWWKNAKKHALLDPRFEVGEGRDPRVEFHDIAQADFESQIERALKRAPDIVKRQAAIRDLVKTIGDSNEDARTQLIATVERERDRSHKPAEKIGWLLLESELTGGDPVAKLAEAFADVSDPAAIVEGIPDDATRVTAATGLLKSGEDGPQHVLDLALKDDAPVADVAAKGFSGAGRDDLLQQLFATVDKKPALYPNLYAWYVKGMRRGKWGDGSADAHRLTLRVLKVVDAVEYRMRRKASALDKRAVAALTDVLTDKSCAIVDEASEDLDASAAHHMVVMIQQNRAFTPRTLEKLQEVVLRKHPGALRDAGGEDAEDPDEPVASVELYMTAAGIDRLRNELEQLTGVEMPQNRAEIARAREFGDLKENAEYHAAREKQGMLEAKARQLESDVARAKAITQDIVRTDAVSVGTRVLLRDADGSESSYTLLGPPDADIERGIINYQTPLAQALMGQKAGAQVRLDIDGSVREMEILEIANGLGSAVGP